MNNDQWQDPNTDRRPDAKAGPGFFSRPRDYMIGPIAILGLFLSVWYLAIPGFMYLYAIENEIGIAGYASVQAMDNSITHEYIVECLEDNIITQGEYNSIHRLNTHSVDRMLEKYPIIEKITGPDIEGR